MRGGRVQGAGSGRSPLQGLSGGRPPPPQIREEKEILVKRAKKEYNENSI